MGDQNYSIDVDNRQIEQLKDLYKALLRISSIQTENHRLLKFSMDSLSTAADSVTRSTSSSTNEEQFKGINEYVRKDFSEVFMKFINN